MMRKASIIKKRNALESGGQLAHLSSISDTCRFLLQEIEGAKNMGMPEIADMRISIDRAYVEIEQLGLMCRNIVVYYRMFGK